MKIPSPLALQTAFPSPPIVETHRRTAANIVQRKDTRLAVIVGPCSIHDEASALEYAHRLKALIPHIENTFFPIMRVFLEKPRTRLGWKGFLYDPHLDGSHDIAHGLLHSRKILSQIADLGIPCAAELLDPIAAPYFSDLITWGLIGARTSSSQPHRQLASGLPFPIGFKNDCEGRLEPALSGILTAQQPQTRLGIDPHGHIAALSTPGNPLAHLVLRGAHSHPNCDPASLDDALHALQSHRLPHRLLVDCSHGNSGKDFRKQAPLFASLVSHPHLIGLMLESHLLEGRQILSEDPTQLRYGVSITDGCMGWEETENLLLSLRPLHKTC